MNLFTRLLNAGITEQLTAYDRRQTKVFNSCNLAGMLIALLRLAYLSFGSPNHYPGFVLFVNALPLLICGSMLICMFLQFFQTSDQLRVCAFPFIVRGLNRLEDGTQSVQQSEEPCDDGSIRYKFALAQHAQQVLAGVG